MNSRFENKVVVVTGAAGGIGKAACFRFAAEKAHIVAVDLPDSGIDELVNDEELKNALKDAAIGIGRLFNDIYE